MKNKIQWEVVASMPDIQAANPDWTEEQCREEFNRLGSVALDKMLTEMESKKRKRKSCHSKTDDKKSCISKTSNNE